MTRNLGVSITWLGHATVLYTASSGKRVLVDAWVDSNPACPEGSKKLPPMDLLLITHGHSDHFEDCISLSKQHHPDIVCMHEIAQYLYREGDPEASRNEQGGIHVPSRRERDDGERGSLEQHPGR